MTDSRYLYLATPGLEVGDIVPPGRWGGIVQSTPEHPWLELERGFERARAHFAPHLPSRFESAFVFEDRDAADLLGKKRPTDALYEVDLVTADAPIHRANIMLLHPEFMTRTDFDWRLNAKEYWLPGTVASDGGDNFTEVLTLSAIRIMALIRPPLT